jgi:uncharacterized protein with ParB-like and HNH nuclease domain
VWEQIIVDVAEQMATENDGEESTTKKLERHPLEHEHYFGAIVVLEKTNSHPSLKSFSVIDGQQRITTIYLLIALVVELLKEKADLSESSQKYINLLDGYIKNR